MPPSPPVYRRGISREDGDVFSRLGAGISDPTPGGSIKEFNGKVSIKQVKDWSRFVNFLSRLGDFLSWRLKLDRHFCALMSWTDTAIQFLLLKQQAQCCSLQAPTELARSGTFKLEEVLTGKTLTQFS